MGTMYILTQMCVIRKEWPEQNGSMIMFISFVSFFSQTSCRWNWSSLEWNRRRGEETCVRPWEAPQAGHGDCTLSHEAQCRVWGMWPVDGTWESGSSGDVCRQGCVSQSVFVSQ